jgi:RHS repeat-associated protein
VLIAVSLLVVAYTVITPLTVASAAPRSGRGSVGMAVMRGAPSVPATAAGRAKPAGRSGASRSADNPDAQPECWDTDSSDCASFNPDVVLTYYSDGDTSSCEFQATVTWGDGSSDTYTFAGAPDGAVTTTFSYTYKDPGTYPVTVTGSAISGSCDFGDFSGSFTLLSAPDPLADGGADNESTNQVNCSTSAPVNCATGVFWHTFADFSVPGRGVPLDLTRTYESSEAGTDGPFGYGWSDSYGMSLATDSAGNVTITQEDGSTVTFSPDGSSGFTAPPYVLAMLVHNSDGSYTFTRDRGETSYGFSAAGHLTRETDLNGYVTTLAFNTAGRLATVTDPAGRTLAFTYSGTHVATVTDPLGRVYTYSYDASGDLVKVTDPLGRSWTFTYNSNHLLLTMTDPADGTISNTYNASGQVTAQSDPDGGTTTWSYSGHADSLAGGSTTITDPDGNETVDQYSELELVSETAGAGTAAAATTSYSYDPATLGVISQTNPDGDTTTSTYDANGNLLTSTDPLGKTTTYTYNSLNEVTSKEDPLGNTTTYGYDGDGNLLDMTDPDGYTTTYAHAGTAHPGDITSVTDPDGHVTSYTYDADGDAATSSVSPSATVTDTTDYAYNADGERYCTVSPVQVAAGVTCPAAGSAAKPGATVTAYDADGEITSVTDPDGNVTRDTYNADGEAATMTDAAGHVTTYAYDGDGQQVKETEPGGSVLTTSYDADGNVTSQVNAAGKATTYAYDALGRVASTTTPLGAVTTYGYDAAGHRTSETDAAGRVTSSTYDADGDLTGVSYSDGTTSPVTYTYNAAGQRTSMTDGTGTTTYSRDADGRTTGVTDGAGEPVSYEYDPAGLPTTIRYPNGQDVTQGYNGAGELTSVQDWLGNTTDFSYNQDGDLTSEAYPNGVAALTTYNKDDQVTSIADKSGASMLASFTYTRDGLGQVTADAESGAVSGTQSYSYTQLSQLSSSSSGAYSYDAAGDLTAQPGGEQQTFNADGQLTATTVPAPVKAGPAEAGSWSASELTKGSSVTSPVVTTKAAGELLLAFVSVDGPAGKTQEVTMVTGGGLTWKLVTRSDGQQGTAEVWQAYATGILSNVKVTADFRYGGYDGAIIVAAFSGAQDAAGAHATGANSTGAPAVMLKTTGTDSVIWAVGEDPSLATSRTADSGQSLALQVDDAKGKATFWAQRTGVIAAAGTSVKTGDTSPTGDKWNLAAVEVLAAIPSATASYSYDKTGDLVQAGPTTLGYNQADELTSYGTTTTDAYNGDGLLMSKTVSGITTDFAWNTTASTPLLIAAGTTYYLYGPGGRPIEQLTGTTPSYLLADQSGGTRLITSSTGAVTGTYTYSAYGTVAKHTGTATTALQFDGQYTDAESGLQYLRARYYDPAIGQFLTLDPLVSATGQPYGYASDNPVNLQDPSGADDIFGPGPGAGSDGVCTPGTPTGGQAYDTPSPDGYWEPSPDQSSTQPQGPDFMSVSVSVPGGLFQVSVNLMNDDVFLDASAGKTFGVFAGVSFGGLNSSGPVTADQVSSFLNGASFTTEWAAIFGTGTQESSGQSATLLTIGLGADVTVGESSTLRNVLIAMAQAWNALSGEVAQGWNILMSLGSPGIAAED